jgi:hypothetical protein
MVPRRRLLFVLVFCPLKVGFRGCFWAEFVLGCFLGLGFVLGLGWGWKRWGKMVKDAKR